MRSTLTFLLAVALLVASLAMTPPFAGIGDNTEAPTHELFRKVATEAGPWNRIPDAEAEADLRRQIEEDVTTRVWPGSTIVTYEALSTPQPVSIVGPLVNKATGGNLALIIRDQAGTIFFTGWDLDATHTVFIGFFTLVDGGTGVVIVELTRDLEAEAEARIPSEEKS